MLLEYCACVFLIMGVVLLLHHGWKHALEPEPSNARHESCGPACYFQLKDISNHETWILNILGNNSAALSGSVENYIPARTCANINAPAAYMKVARIHTTHSILSGSITKSIMTSSAIY